MESVEITVVGAGVVGLAIARELAADGRDIIVVEKNPDCGWETSSRNSEVIHAGLYYPEAFLKTRFCVEGRKLLYEFCDRYRIPCSRVGKLIVAADEHEREDLEKITAQAAKNGIEDLALLTEKELKVMEPHVRGVAAIHSPSTGILSTHRLMKCLESLAERQGAVFAYNCEVTAIERTSRGYEITAHDADGKPAEVASRIVINSAGLSSERVAGMAGTDTKKAGYTLHYCKGEYFRIRGTRSRLVGHLVYSTPTQISVGIHTVVDLQDQMKLGPNAFYVDSIDYSVDPSHATEFYTSARKFLPFLEPADLAPDMSGIRPKLQGPGDPVRDFIIREEGKRGLPGFINLIGIESPGLTACLAIAKHVGEMVRQL